MKNLITLFAFLLFVTGCSKEEKDSPSVAAATPLVKEPSPALIVAVGKVEPENELINLSSPVGGIVKATWKKDGDRVAQGEAIVQLDDDIEQRKTQEIRLQIQTQRSQLVIDQTQARETELTLANKNTLLAKTKRLVESGAETQQTLEDLATEIGVLEVTLERSKARIQLATNKLNELVAQQQTAEVEASKKRLTAPYDGVLLDLQVNKGEAINALSTYAEFAPNGNLMVRAEVDELFSSNVKVGQPVDIVYTGSERVLATGQVILVSPYLKKKSLFSEKASDQEDRRVREMRIAIKDSGNLIINSKVECNIKL